MHVSGEDHPQVKHPSHVVRAARILHELGLTQAQIAKQLKVRRTTIKSWLAYENRHEAESLLQ